MLITKIIVILLRHLRFGRYFEKREFPILARGYHHLKVPVDTGFWKYDDISVKYTIAFLTILVQFFRQKCKFSTIFFCSIQPTMSLHAKNYVCRSNGVTCGQYKDKEGKNEKCPGISRLFALVWVQTMSWWSESYSYKDNCVVFMLMYQKVDEELYLGLKKTFEDWKNEKNHEIQPLNLCSGADNSVNFRFWAMIISIHPN